MDEFPPGDYVFELEVQVGEEMVTVPYVITTINPCATGEITILEFPFTEGPYEYIVNEEAFVLTYDSTTMFESGTTLDCGTPTFKFMTTAEEKLDSDLFSEDKDEPTANKLIIGTTDDGSKAGEYELMIRFYYSENPLNYVDSESFTVSVIHLCTPPAGYDAPTPTLTPPVLEDVEYFITDEPKVYQIPSWTSSPAFCAEEITLFAETTVDGEAGPMIKFDGDTFTFEYDDSLDLAGTDFKDYPISITAKLGDEEVSTSFNLVVKNPCVSSEHLSVSTDGAVPDFSYTVYNTTEASWKHFEFKIEGSDKVKNLCGPMLSYVVNAGDLSEFVTYDADEMRLSIYSEDMSLLD
jgi:hypothetical protein